MESSVENIRNDKMLETPDTKMINNGKFHHFVESALTEEDNQDYIARCTANSFLSVTPVADEVGFENDERNIRNWFARMLAKGASPVTLLEKARVFDPFGHAGFDPSGIIKLTLSGKIKMTPVADTAGEFFCSFENPCSGTAGFNVKYYKYDCKIKSRFDNKC